MSTWSIVALMGVAAIPIQIAYSLDELIATLLARHTIIPAKAGIHKTSARQAPCVRQRTDAAARSLHHGT